MTKHRLTVIAFFAGLAASFLGGTIGLWSASSVSAIRTEPMFVYGTLENDLFRSVACECFTKGIPAQITGFTEGRDSLIDMESGVVRGELVMLSQAELKRLDTYIGFPETHYRITVKVGSEPAWAYIRRGADTERTAANSGS